MIENYSNVTEEFYGLYRGNHANRDRVYERKPDSFLAGSFLRPTSLILVESIFIFVFRIFYRIAQFIFSVRRFLTSIRSRKPCHSTASAETIVKTHDKMPQISSSTSIISSQSTDSSINPDVVISAGLPLDGQVTTVNHATCSLNDIYEMEDHTDGGDADSVDMSTFSCDEASSATCSTSSTVVTTRPCQDRFWRFELPFSHNLAIIFIKLVMAQGRIESRIRKRYAHHKLVCRLSDRVTARKRNKHFSEYRKRKCSEDISPDDFNGKSMFELQLTESLIPAGSSCSSMDSYGGSDQLLLEDNVDIGKGSTNMLIGRTYTDHGLNSRKVKSSSNLQV